MSHETLKLEMNCNGRQIAHLVVDPHMNSRTVIMEAERCWIDPTSRARKRDEIKSRRFDQSTIHRLELPVSFVQLKSRAGPCVILEEIERGQFSTLTHVAEAVNEKTAAMEGTK